MTWKRILLIIGFLLVVVLAAFLLYRFFFATLPPPPVAQEPTSPIEEPFPEADERKRITGIVRPPVGTPGEEAPPLALVDETLPQTALEALGGRVQTFEIQSDRNASPTLAGDGKSVVTFDRYDGTFYRIPPRGTPEKLTDQTFLGADVIEWSPNAEKAAISFYDGSNIIYDFKNKKQYSLPKHWQDFAFAPSGEDIAFKALGEFEENRWLATSNIDGSSPALVEPLGKKAGLFDASWSPSGQIIGTFHEISDGFRQKVYFIGLHGENFKGTTVEGLGLKTEWSPKGDRLLYSVYSPSSDYNPELWAVDALGDSIGNNRRRLNVQTWVDKCAFATNDVAYCAVPQGMPKGAGILRSLTDSLPDHIYKVDLLTGETIKIAEPAIPQSVGSVVVSRDEGVLYFTNAASGKLYKIDL